MNVILKSASVLALALCAITATAQERAASGDMDVQVTWTALKSEVDSAKAGTEIVKVKVDQVIKCNKKMMLYAPGASGADGDGCIALEFAMLPEYVESAGWQRPSYTLACTKGRKITRAMVNVSTNPNQLACNRTGSGCDGDATASFKGKSKWDVQVDPGKYVSAFIECK